ncbi:MAG TPA: hypothetical protein VL049_04005 [Candidatus Dormibacteraeota bacterium]|nr:hypothetical protein [Candidatus Dormibacteraeota bacterium]
MARLHDFPLWLVGLSTLVVFVGGSLVGLAITRGWSRRRTLHALVDNSVIGWIFSAILGIYAIAIGLIAVESWGNSAEASAAASREAAEIAALYRDLGGYPQPQQGTLEAALSRYTHYVIEEAWPQQRRGEVPRGGTLILNDLQRVLYAFEPVTEGQKAAHAEALRAFNSLIEFRRQRLEAVDYAVPRSLWSVVVIGALLSITASYVFSMESFWVHAAMTSLLAAMIGLLVFFILITDLPYRGQAGIGPEAYELVLHDLIEPRAGR